MPLMKGLLLVWFMVITCFGVVHNAEHGFHKHYHYGHECPIYDFCEHQNLGSGLPLILLMFLAAMAFMVAVSHSESLRDILPVAAAPARAPPRFS